MNLPNKLTIGRVVAVPFFIAAYMLEYYLVAFIITLNKIVILIIVCNFTPFIVILALYRFRSYETPRNLELVLLFIFFSYADNLEFSDFGISIQVSLEYTLHPLGIFCCK